MKDPDVNEVKSALQMADREWANNGLIGTDKGSQEGGTLEALMYLDAFRGEHPAVLDRAVETVDQMVGNLVFSIINAQHAQISARDPQPIVRPTGGTAAKPDAWRRAWLNQQIIAGMMQEKKYKRQNDRALLSALLLPFGLVRHGYTPDVDEYEKDGIVYARFKNETPEMPWVRFLRPWQVRIDPLVDNFDADGEARWVAFHNLYTRAQIQNNPALIMREDWKPTQYEDLRPMHERKKPKFSHSGQLRAGSTKTHDKGMALYEEWVIYDADTRMFFGVSPGSDKLVRPPREWPIDTGQLPYSILTMNEQLDSPFGIPFPRMVWSEQRMYNKIWTIINALVERTRSIMGVNGAAFDQHPEQLDNLLNGESLVEFIVSSGNPREVLQAYNMGQIDGQLVGLLYQLKEQIREVLGVSSFDRGQRANVETAAEANQIGAGSATNRSRVQARYEAFLVDEIRYTHRALLQTEDTRKFTVPTIGAENAAFLTQGEVANGFVQVGLGDLMGEFVYGVKPNSTLPHDPAAEFNALHTAIVASAAVGQNPLVQPQPATKRLFTLAGQDAEQMVVQPDVAVQMGQNDPNAAGPQSPNSTPSPIEGVPNAPNIPGAE